MQKEDDKKNERKRERNYKNENKCNGISAMIHDISLHFSKIK
jgi:hypothetical protein